MLEESDALPWNRPGWLEEASAWIHTQLARQGLQSTSSIEVLHRRPWSAFARVETTQSLVYFKAPASPVRFEAALTEALARWRPDCTVPLLAVDVARGWMLSADAGPTLRSVIQSAEDLGWWGKVLPLYAELQMEMAGRVPELLALGLPDRRLAELPRLYEQLLEDTDNLRVGQPEGLTAEEYERLCDLRPRVAALCEQLDAYGLPETLAHEEVHDNNVVVGDGRIIFADWSDSSVGHPFFTLLVTLRSAAYRLKLAAEGPEIAWLRDIYLAPWMRFAPREALLAAFNLAYRLGMINRALSYHAIFGWLAEADREQQDHTAGWLQDFLEAETKGAIHLLSTG